MDNQSTDINEGSEAMLEAFEAMLETYKKYTPDNYQITPGEKIVLLTILYKIIGKTKQPINESICNKN